MNFIVNTDTNKILGTGVVNEAPNEIVIKNNNEDVLNAFYDYNKNFDSVEDEIIGLDYYIKYDGEDIIVTPLEDKANILADILVKRLDKINSEYILSRYSLKRQNSFTNLKIDAMELSRQDIIDECNKIKYWIFNYPMNYYYQKEAEIFQMRDNIISGNNTLEDLIALEDSWDFEQFTQYDPAITIFNIMSMF